MKHQIEYIETEKLVPYARNSRTHSDEQVQQIMGSIKEFGFTNPILVDADGLIIAGHGRTMAAQRMGIKEVPCLRLGHLTDAQKKAYVIADNKLALNAGWDDEMLRLELADLQDADFDLSLTGFDDDELNALLAKAVEEGLTDEDAVPEVPETPVTVEGDVWILGRHRLMCGDSTSIDAVEKLMDGQLADMVFTDPPYNADYSSRVDKSRRKPWGGIINDNMSEEAFDAFLNDINSIYWQIMVNGAAIYECIDWKRYPQMAAVFSEAFSQKAMIVWNKNYFGLGTYYRTKHEIILFGVKGEKLNVWNAAHDEMDVWDVDREKVKNYQHPTQKPVRIPERAIKNSSKTADIVADLFLGSGSTLIACEKMQRSCCGMELDPKYCDVIIKRWQDFTGKKAIHAETQKPFDELSNGTN
jgi:DNA modification methylase